MPCKFAVVTITTLYRVPEGKTIENLTDEFERTKGEMLDNEIVAVNVDVKHATPEDVVKMMGA